jgi:hypothetical protein
MSDARDERCAVCGIVPPDHWTNCTRRPVYLATLAERAAVVAWLRERAARMLYGHDITMFDRSAARGMSIAADAIERGEHVAREGEA